MKLIIEALEESDTTQYEYLGANMLLDPNLISLNLIARQNAVRGELNIRGLIDMPLQLQAQYDNRSAFNDHAEIRKQIETDLANISDKINRLL